MDVKNDSSVKIAIQTADFNLTDEVDLLEKQNDEDGAVVTFSGRVRNNNLGKKVSGLFLEHYPGMTEKSLHSIIEQAQQKWQIGRITVIHRIGQLKVGEQIVFVGVTSKHRQDAFSACEFIMDYLKVSAPFWKKELSDGVESWLEAKQSDEAKAKLWQS
ncbi:molybdopterin synthase catalytic subunit MoaE [Thalassotalea castellviae]|uniref:Molybdopterin synthase catalytic subunit n=1 Tax=Thalassotalea castellviae TaxID=3075612 RepID=A0ABU3A3A4_9GAMM|nr:molybdopterin synthase catalytic subunit MoaE [Thalassotalea sp. W431]MDT0603451.1 molybdopterin synthase catalytic subunit MoaE [Thalassotalea sp. W431]